MAKRSSETPLERRLRELEEEERLLQQHLKQVERRVRTAAPAEVSMGRGEPRLASSVLPPGMERDARPPAQKEAGSPAVEAQHAERGPARPGMAPRNPGVMPADRFANFFANGSFGKARPLGRERRVMRNKAIFMLIVVGVVAFLLYRLAFGS